MNIIKFNEINDKIIVIRNENVILDSDVAELYGVETMRINEAVKNNFDKFPEGYIIRLRTEEWKNLKSKISISSWGGKNKLPNAFTEKGLYMLATILKAMNNNMKIQLTFIACAILLLCNACLSDNYFDGLNSIPEITTTVNLLDIDTLKIGNRHNVDKNVHYALPVTVSDRNYNLKSFVLDIDESFIITNKLSQPLNKYYDLNNAQHGGKWSETFYLYPTLPGLYQINLRATDKFNTDNTIYKELYVFDNYPPKCIAHDASYIIYQLINIIYLDLSASFDRDERWGGKIASYHALYHYSWDDEPFPMGSGGVNTPHPWLLEISDFAWQPIGRIEAWVTDDEGAESEHINITPVKSKL